MTGAFYEIMLHRLWFSCVEAAIVLLRFYHVMNVVTCLMMCYIGSRRNRLITFVFT